MNPKVSVIVPNYNHAPYLKLRIDSILNQSFQDFELILLDDCSSDNSRDVLDSYKNHPKVSHCVYNTTNSGSTFIQWERGIQLAQGEYIWIAESDDWADSNFLEKTITLLEHNSSVGLVYSALIYTDAAGTVTYDNKAENTSSVVYYKGLELIQTRFLMNNAIGNASAVVFRKSVFSQIRNQAYKQMTYCGDWLFYIQICEISDIIYLQSTLTYYRVHHGNVSNKAKKNGKYFTEGLEVFSYICKIGGVTIRSTVWNDWAEQYVLLNAGNEFSKELRKTIKTRLKSMDQWITYRIAFYRFRFILKTLFPRRKG